jgi:hypothetical protein
MLGQKSEMGCQKPNWVGVHPKSEHIGICICICVYVHKQLTYSRLSKFRFAWKKRLLENPKKSIYFAIV